MLYSAWLYVCTEGGGNKKLFRRAIRGNEVDLVRRIEVESGLWIHLLSSKVLTEEQLELCRSEVFCSIIFAPWKLLVIISIYSAIMDICQPSDQAIWVWPVACLWGGGEIWHGEVLLHAKCHPIGAMRRVSIKSEKFTEILPNFGI